MITLSLMIFGGQRKELVISFEKEVIYLFLLLLFKLF